MSRRRGASLALAGAFSRLLGIVLALIAVSAALPAGTAHAQYLQFSQVPPNPSGGSAPVQVSFGGRHGYWIDAPRDCQIVDDGPPCEGAYIWYDDYVDPSYFQFTVNGAPQTLAIQMTSDWCTEYSGGRDCQIAYVAYGTATFPDGGITLVAQSYCPGCNAWYSASYSFTADGAPPTVVLSPGSGGTFSSRYLSVGATATDPSGFNAGSRTITLNGVAQSQANMTWNVSGAQATFRTTVSLVRGTNTVTASICDGFNHCSAPVSATYTYNPPTPTAQITAGTRNGAAQTFRIDWRDANNELDEASRSLIWNGVAVSQSTYNLQQDDAPPDPRTYYSTITLPLRAGSNTLSATICNIDRVCVDPPTTRSVTYDAASPSVTITPSSGSFKVPTIAMSVAYCDETSLSALSQLIELTPVTTPDPKRVYPNPWGYTVVSRAGCAAAANAGGTVELSPGHNSFHAHIADNGGNPGDRVVDLIYDPNPPIITILPTSGGTVGNPTLAVSVSWKDDQALDVNSRSLTLGSTDVYGQFTTTTASDQRTASSTGTITLAPGMNRLTARVCDAAGNCPTTTATYTLDTSPPTVTFSPLPGTLLTTPTQTITLTLGDATALSPANFRVTLNGAVVTPAFTAIGSGATATSVGTVSLAAGADTLVVHVCDSLNNCADRTSAYTVDLTAPTVAISPASGTMTNQTLSATVTWGDDQALSAGTRTLTLNGADVTSAFSYTASSASVATSVGPLQLSNGTNTFTARICDAAGRCTSQSASYDLSVVVAAATSVAVSPRNTRITVAPGGTRTQVFSVQPVRNGSTTFNVSVTCPGLPSCSVPTTVTSPSANAPASVSVTYDPGAHGTRGRMVLVVGYGTSAVVRDSAYVDITTRDASKSWIAMSELNPGTSVERDLCLTIAVGPGAAYQCGDLRLTHALPSTRTMGTTRTPTLVYLSSAALAMTRLAADVTLAPGDPAPQSVTACATFANGSQQCGTWSGASFNSTSARRITLRINGSSLPISSSQVASLHAYTFTVTGNFGAAGVRTIGTATGELIIVDRRNSKLGWGWALAGLEQLFVLTGNRILWVDGEGSSRVYEPVGDNRWRAPTVDRPDSLSLANGTYTRWLPNNVRVQFNNTGHHVATINRLNQTTYFRYDASTGDTLKAIRLALPASRVPGTVGTVPDSLYYAFDYQSSGPVTTNLVITAPPAGATVRKTTLALIVGNLYWITDPDGKQVQYGTSSGQIFNRTDKLQRSVSFSYDTWADLLTSATRPLGVNMPSIVTRFTPAEMAGGNWGFMTGPSVDPDSAYTLVNGPRLDTTVTRFWVNRWGAPWRVRNALGEVTQVDRGDLRFPALVTQQVAPNGFTTLATYDGRGRMTTSTAVNPYGDGRNPVTTYTYHPVWDALTSVTLPEGERTTFGVDATTGNRLWQEDKRGSLSRVNFTYYTDTARFGMLQSVQPAGATCDVTNTRVCETYVPDALGNLAAAYATTGFKTEYVQDAAGRTVKVRTQIDAAGTRWRTDTTMFDVMGRDSLTRTVADADTLWVQPVRDVEGQTLSIARWVSPDWAKLGVIRDTMVYDWAGRMLKKASAFPDSITGIQRWEQLAFDDANNVTRTIDRDGRTINLAYDPLNRVSTKIYSQFGTKYTPMQLDTTRFAYDNLGNVRAADNLVAKVHRGYYPGGALRSDTLQISNSDLTFPGHQYVIGSAYDMNGRRTELTHPANLLSAFTMVDSRTRYGYDPATGGLASVTDPANNVFGYEYDGQGRVWRTTTPSSYETKTFNTLGQLVIRDERGLNGTIFHHDSITYGEEGKIAYVNAMGDVASFTYTGFGAVRVGDMGSSSDQRLDVDALGNVTRNHRGGGDANATQRSTYQSHSTRLSKMGESLDASRGTAIDTLFLTYDNAGNVWTQNFESMADTAENTIVIHSAPSLASTTDAAAGAIMTTPWQSWVKTSFAYTKNEYGDDGRLKASQRNTSEDNFTTDKRTLASTGFAGLVNAPSLGRGVYEEYRYDALGRRVWVRSIRKPFCTRPTVNTECLGAVQRTIWDGDQVLYEVRQPGDSGAAAATMEYDGQPSASMHFGVVGYTHGLGIDAPVGLFRSAGNALVLHRAWRGGIDEGTAMDGTRLECSQPGHPTPCLWINWGASQTLNMARNWSDSGPPSWYGALATQNRDATGQMYMRNRMYDPISGRFTQEDPIGLAGGLNLYGFGGGDPVNYSDPFGLCPNKFAGGLAALQCLFQDFFAGASLAAENTANAGYEASGKTVVYARGGAGVLSTQAEVDGHGRVAARARPSIGTQAVGVAAGVRYDVNPAPEGSTAVRVSAGPRVGPVRVQVQVTRAFSSNGESVTTSVGLEASMGVSRLPGLPGGASVTPPAEVCVGTRCPR